MLACLRLGEWERSNATMIHAALARRVVNFPVEANTAAARRPAGFASRAPVRPGAHKRLRRAEAAPPCARPVRPVRRRCPCQVRATMGFAGSLMSAVSLSMTLGDIGRKPEPV